MKRTTLCLVAALLCSAAAVGTSHAATAARTIRGTQAHATVHVAASAACPIHGCTGPCPLQGKGATATGSLATSAMHRGACPVSDPSVCPPSCQRQATGAVAARVTSH